MPHSLPRFLPWNWELPDWPHFTFDSVLLIQRDRDFLLNSGKSAGFIKKISKDDYQQFAVEILSSEGLESSLIEGEILDRDSLQSSIKRHFGLQSSTKEKNKEAGVAKLTLDVYESFDAPLTDEMLFRWHDELFKEKASIEDKGKYRSHDEPMQIVSNRYDILQVFYEALPSKRVPQEMLRYIKWFNASKSSDSILARASLAHLYFEMIHPFEDGNGRIGRLLVEKILSQGIGRPVLIAVSKVLESRKKEYYAQLERCNKTLQISSWIDFFSGVILEAQKESIHLLNFLIEKSWIFRRLKDQLNPRQEKVLLRIFAEGPKGFRGGLSSENYTSITKASKATATRDLNDLVSKGALVKTGELRHTRYWLPSLINSD